MVTVRHDIGWVAPSPLWSRCGNLADAAERRQFARPAILRFAHDAFMDEMLALLAYHPENLDEWIARFETWERPMARPTVSAKLALPEPVSHLRTRLTRLAARHAAGREIATVQEELPSLKLYQPVHQRYYLVTASLVCRQPGLPDRHANPSRQERVSFVLRRLLPRADATGEALVDPRLFDEFAYVQTGPGFEWRPVAGARTRVVTGEERLPLFQMGVQVDQPPPRRILGGLIPVARRETYVNAPVRTQAAGEAADADAEAATPPDTRLLLLQMRVTGPWSELVTQARDWKERFQEGQILPEGCNDEFDPPPAQPAPDTSNQKRAQIQTVSWYVVLDLMNFLATHLPRVWSALLAHSETGLDPTLERPLLQWLEQATFVLDKSAFIAESPHYTTSAICGTLGDALRAMAGEHVAEDLEAVDVGYDRVTTYGRWPGFLCPLADIGQQGPFPFRISGIDLSGPGTADKVNAALRELDSLAEQALSRQIPEAMPEIPLVQKETEIRPGEAWFTIRCVYERPNCGPRAQEVVSEPTEPFRMAGFFDHEAPARPIRIPLPIDVSPAALRKHNKSVTLMVTDALCGHLKKIRKMSLGDLVLSVLPWPFHKDLPDPSTSGGCNNMGMFCSLSIPIVTLCALILMIIMVALFDIFFRWLPFLFLCLPIPGFGKDKKP